MKVILLQNVPKIGQKGEVKEVKEGYARNMLFPKGLAKVATNSDIQNIKQKKVREEVNHDLEVKEVASIFKSLEGKRVEIQEKSNEKGHLFSRVHTEEVIEAVKKEFNIELSRDWFSIDVIKEVGEYPINLSFEKLKSNFILEVK